jgi:ribonuclease BN (tRNA processing enzyme)
MSPRLFATISPALLVVLGGAAQAQLPAGGGAIQLHRTRVVVLGTGTPNADPDRSGPSVAIVVKGATYLVDAGPGIVRRAAAARLFDTDSNAMASLATVFLTHLHSDHTAGLPDLMLTPWVLGRTAPLRVFGPSGTAAMLGHLQRAYSEDVELRLTGGEPSNQTGHRVRARDVTPGIVYRDSNVTVTAFAVDHGAWKHAYGYRFHTADRTIVISGDTRPTEEIVRQCAGCDVLVHEVYSAERLAARSEAWRRYHSRYHTSTTELASLATRAKPELLVLYHQLYWGDDDDALVRQVRSGYTGRVVSAHDLGVY